MLEEMITRAVLQDGFSPVLRKIAGEQDAFSRKTNALNMGGNVLIGMGAAVIGFGAKAIQAAGKVDEFRRIVEKVRGANEAAFATKFINDYDKRSSFAYFDLMEAAQRMELQNVDLGKSFKDVADIAAMSGRPLMDVARLYDAVSTGRVGLGLSSRGGFAQFGVSVKDIFAAAGKPYTPGHNLQNSMTGTEELDAVHKVLVEKHKAGLDEALATTTLRGSQSMIEGAMERLESNVGAGSLPATVAMLNNVAGAINSISDAVKNVPGFGDKLFGTGAGLIAGGAILKGVAAWKTYAAIQKTAAAAGALERAGEVAKVPIANAEGNAVNLLSGKYGGLRGSLLKAGEASLGARAATTGLTGTFAAGIGTAGLYAVAIAGVVFDIGLLVKSFQEANDASRDFESSIAAVAKAKAMGYDVAKNGGKVTGYDALPVWQQIEYQVLNTGSFGGLDLLTDGAYTPGNAGITATADDQSRALAKKHGRVKGGVMDQYIKEQKARAAAAAAAKADAGQAAGQAADGYKLPPAMEFKLSQDERRLELLKAMGGHERELAQARKQEIGDLNTAAGLLEKQAAIATDLKKKYDLLNQAADDRQKAKLLGLEKADGRSKLDKVTAAILGAGGLGEDEILKRAGIGRGFFAGMSKGHLPKNPMKQAIEALEKRPLIVNFHIGDKIFGQVKDEIVDDALHKLLRLSETSGKNALFGN